MFSWRLCKSTAISKASREEIAIFISKFISNIRLIEIRNFDSIITSKQHCALIVVETE